jgi:pimeloyl-ACP methyl ester carboxylesterase
VTSQQSWIFLRGLSREHEHWGEFTNQFSTNLNAKVHCPDMPGTGNFWKETSPSTIGGIVDHLVTYSSWEISEQSWILAHSMGCLVALEWMQREPHRFHGAVLINTSAKGFSPMFQRLKFRGWLNFFRIFFAGNNLKKREEIKYSLLSNSLEKRDEAILTWMDIQKNRPVSTQTTWNQIRAAGFYKAHKPRYPVLILSSLGDHLVDPSCSAVLAEQWQLPIRTHPWAGHDLAFDDPKWVIDQIKQWMKNLA